MLISISRLIKSAWATTKGKIMEAVEVDILCLVRRLGFGKLNSYILWIK